MKLKKSVVMVDVPLPTYSDGERILKVLCRQHGIEMLPEIFERFVNGALGLTEREIKRMYARILLGGSGSRVNPICRFSFRKSDGRSADQNGVLGHTKKSDVGGLDNLKRWLSERSKGFSTAAKAFGLPDPKGLFCSGFRGAGNR